MKTVSLKVSEDLDARLWLLARRSRSTKSAVLRQAIENHLARGKRAPAGVFLELARDLAGCVEGPRDLSTNKGYMRRYGR
ncbi:MAG: ribbon-helix-helix protein, CopG family [Acidobacteriota bacterium]